MKKIIIGKTQELTVLRSTEHGIYLGPENAEESVLLPKNQVPENAAEGQKLRVFVYRDSEDRPVASLRSPLAEAGEFAYLRVKSVTRIGAFLDWGLEKDLFLPYREQETELRAGDHLAVYLYTDKSERMCASMRLYDHLSPSEKGQFRKDDSVRGFVYRIQPKVGCFIAVRGKEDTGETGMKKLYFGLIPANQLYEHMRPGEAGTFRVTRVRQDGKLDLSARENVVNQLAEDGQTILKLAESYGGTLPFGEDASPEMIRRELHMSKAAFKRALGHLLKEGKAEIGQDGTVRV